MAALADVKTKKPKPIKEIIGRTPPMQVLPRRLRASGETADTTKPDYAWWDMVRHCRKHGYELSGAFIKPITQITTSWVWGKSASAELTDTAELTGATPERIEHTNAVLDEFVMDNLAKFQGITRDLYGLGDQYVIVNMDGTLSIPSPDTVDVQRDPLDYRRITSVTICAKYQNAKVEDTYTEDLRTVFIDNTSDKDLVTRFGIIPAKSKLTFEFDNLIGIIPVVHFACDRSADETNGRPLADGMVRLLSRYDDLFEKALDGAETLSDPIPVLSVEPGTVEEMYNLNTVETSEQDEDGNPVRKLDLGYLKAIITTKGFSFASPGSFTGDISSMLGLLFLLLLEHVRIPETVWGGELGQSRSSTVEQMDTFRQYILERRLQLEGERTGTGSDGMLKLLYLYLLVKALTDPQIIVGYAAMLWQPLDIKDEKLEFEKVKYAHGTGNLTDATMVDKLDIVTNPEEEVEAAHEEAQARQDAFDAAMDADAAAGEDEDEEDETDDTEAEAEAA